MKKFLAILLVLCMTLPAYAQGHVIYKLGAAPVYSPSNSFREFVAKMHRDRARERAALSQLGVDYAEFEAAIRSGAEHVKLPNHLDAMTYYAGSVKTIRDVTLANTFYGWKVHVGGHIVYIPAICGNFAVNEDGVKKHEARVKSSTESAPAPTSNPVATMAPTPTPTATQTPVPLAVVHHARFPWWILLVPAVLIHGGNSGATPTTPPVTPTRSPSPSPSTSPSTSPSPSPSPSPSSSPSHSPSPSPSPTHTPCGCPSPTPKPTPTHTPCASPTPTPRH